MTTTTLKNITLSKPWQWAKGEELWGGQPFLWIGSLDSCYQEGLATLSWGSGLQGSQVGCLVPFPRALTEECTTPPHSAPSDELFRAPSCSLDLGSRDHTLATMEPASQSLRVMTRSVNLSFPEGLCGNNCICNSCSTLTFGRAGWHCITILFFFNIYLYVWMLFLHIYLCIYAGLVSKEVIRECWVP